MIKPSCHDMHRHMESKQRRTVQQDIRTPAGSADLMPLSTSESFRPAEADLLTVGARPNRPATKHAVVDATMIYSTTGWVDENAASETP